MPSQGMEIHARLSQNMRRLRQEKDWSQEELAHQTGLHRTYISDLERGARNPSIKIIDKIAVAFGASCGDLLD